MELLNKVKKIIDIESDSSKLSSIETIKKDVYLRGANIFYLICSATLASVGLDVGSPAVIIGAMLISPLMSPILGVGLSLGIHDKESFFISLREFFFSIILSLFISSFYFSLTPLGHPTSEILARTKPTALDILVAFFGGVAGIIAITRSKIANALPGVAIATALMPPICVAGFGLATAKFEFFFGAFYLFFINAVFISFSSYLIVRYLRFPFKEYLDKKKLLRTRIIIYLFVLFVAIPSFIIFYNVISDAKLNRNLNKFVREQIQSQNVEILDWKFIHGKNNENVLNVYTVGNKISQKKLDSINLMLSDFGIENTKVKIFQLSDERGIENIKGELKTDFLSALNVSQTSNTEQDSSIKQKIYKNDSANFMNVQEELKLFFPEIEEIGFSNYFINKSFVNDSSKINNLPILTIKWKKNYNFSSSNNSGNKIYEFMKKRFKYDTLVVFHKK